MSASPVRIGFVGCGKIASAMVRGFCSEGGCKPAHITLSPRNKERAEELAALHPSLVSVAASNQAVVDGSSVVFVSLLPDVAKTQLPELSFTAEHTVVSNMATVPLAELQELLPQVPPEQIARCVPLPPCSRRGGPILLIPRVERAVEVLDWIGQPVLCESEAEMKPLISLTALISPFHELQAGAADWAVEEGVNREVAGTFVGSFFDCLASQARSDFNAESNTFGDMAQHAATPGGLNEQVAAELKEGGFFTLWRSAIAAIRRRLG